MNAIKQNSVKVWLNRMGRIGFGVIGAEGDQVLLWNIYLHFACFSNVKRQNAETYVINILSWKGSLLMIDNCDLTMHFECCSGFLISFRPKTILCRQIIDSWLWKRSFSSTLNIDSGNIESTSITLFLVNLFGFILQILLELLNPHQIIFMCSRLQWR